jgi:hypothetical protein
MAGTVSDPGPPPVRTAWQRGRAWVARHRLLAGATATAVLAAAVAVPVTLAGDASATPCWTVPASVRALADDPAAAAKALDPGPEADRIERVRRLLDHEGFCGDGARVLGRVIAAGTSASAPGRAHTEAQARAAYAVTSVVAHADEIPRGLAPAVARVLAEYVVDANQQFHSFGDSDDVLGPAESADSASTLDASGFTHYGRFLDTRDAHVNFDYLNPYSGAQPVRVDDLTVSLALDPEAFAILYDAQLAYLAHYLERLNDRGGDPAARFAGAKDSKEDTGYASDHPDPRTFDWIWPDNDLQRAADVVGTLMNNRTQAARAVPNEVHGRYGTIDDLPAFDAKVRSQMRGQYRTAGTRLTSRPPMGSIADRPVTGRLHGDVFDGREQMFRVYDTWARDRGVPAERAAGLRRLMEERYSIGYGLGT